MHHKYVLTRVTRIIKNLSTFIRIVIVLIKQSPTLSTTPTHMVREAAIPALPLNGKLASKVIRRQVKDRISSISANNEGRVPGLGIVMANGCVSNGMDSIPWATRCYFLSRKEWLDSLPSPSYR